jgi:hypothetical protein
MKHIPEGLGYACVYWASHLTIARKEETWTAYVCKLLYKFLRDHVLHWIECLSLLGRLDVAIESFRTMEGWPLVRGFVLNVYQYLIFCH